MAKGLTTMKLIRATETSSEELTDFLKSSSLPGIIDIQVRRRGSFFNHYRLLSEDFVSLVLIDKKNKIQALATIVFSKGKIQGEEQIIGYATDLRVSSSRSAIVHWSEMFLPALLEERDRRGCRYIFSSVGKSYTQAYNAFIRPRTTKRFLPRYFLYKKFSVVNVHGVFPFSAPPLKSVQIRKANVEDLTEIDDYIQKKQLYRPMVLQDWDVSYNLSHWPYLRPENFLLALDAEKNVVGCCSLWDPTPVQVYQPSKWKKRALTFRQTLKFLRLLGMAHSLSHPSDPLNFLQLNHLYGENPDIIDSLLKASYGNTSKKHYFSYVHFDGDLSTLPPKGLLTTQIPFGLYCILSPDDPIPDFLKPKFYGEPPDFHLAFL